ncbi:hypothetical protein PLESTB_001698500 [Pleodorina starrii]|uniref:Uncharacterized protein n=1 Tax=Pleodorina starrii TaxID=330485 RepID=A0A9W6F9T2_9CHLO|nr:hypothetical protein PLESTB_001698500 [Pleodorina starrii]GLC76726.1 hypothetical protein PLESTF_001823700 [Pleodorina starrii]
MTSAAAGHTDNGAIAGVGRLPHTTAPLPHAASVPPLRCLLHYPPCRSRSRAESCARHSSGGAAAPKPGARGRALRLSLPLLPRGAGMCERARRMLDREGPVAGSQQQQQQQKQQKHEKQ